MSEIEAIYNEYSQKIFNLAYRMTGNKEDASDITQETFIQVINSIDKFKGDSQIYSWLYKIAKNNCLQHLNKKNKSSFVSMEGLIYESSSPVSAEISETEKQLYIQQVKDGCLSKAPSSLSKMAAPIRIK